jgi:hypothetical protein
MKGLMKSSLFAVLMIVLGTAITSTSAHAETGSRVSVNIPFDFVIGDAPLKAGTYTVEQVELGVLSFSGHDGQEHRFALTVPGDSANGSHHPHFVFTRYGTETFLNKVFLSADDDCNQFPRSSREKKLVQHRALGDELSLLIEPVR